MRCLTYEINRRQQQNEIDRDRQKSEETKEVKQKGGRKNTQALKVSHKNCHFPYEKISAQG